MLCRIKNGTIIVDQGTDKEQTYAAGDAVVLIDDAVALAHPDNFVPLKPEEVSAYYIARDKEEAERARVEDEKAAQAKAEAEKAAAEALRIAHEAPTAPRPGQNVFPVSSLNAPSQPTVTTAPVASTPTIKPPEPAAPAKE